MLAEAFISKVFHCLPCIGDWNGIEDDVSLVISWEWAVLLIDNEGCWVVHQKEIDIVQLKIFESLTEGWLHKVWAMLGAPELGCDPEIFTLDLSFLKDFLEGLTNDVFVAIATSAVNVAIASNFNCVFDCIDQGFVLWGLPGTEANLWDGLHTK